MIRKFYEKRETALCIGLIVLYVVINSYALQTYGTTDYRCALINFGFAAALLALTCHLGKTGFYGLRPVANPKAYLYFLPLAVLASVNLWNGIQVRNTAGEIACHIFMMLNVGFIEEMIFRGYLFRMMERDNLRSAMVVSALTFGMGHIVNLLNGADLIPTLLQLCYAAAIGWAFVVVFHKSQSLLPCILTHGVLNALSVFAVETDGQDYVITLLLIAVSLGYGAYLNRRIPD